MDRKKLRKIASFLYALLIFIFFTHAAASLGEVIPSPLSGSIAQPTITRIYKDATGFLWIGTQQGLYKFDGSNVRKFDSAQEDPNFLSNSDIRGISQRSNGDMIIATFGGGLLELKRSGSKFGPLDNPYNASNLELTDFHQITDDYFLATSKSGIVPIDLTLNQNFDWIIGQLLKLQVDDIVDVVKIDSQTALLASNASLIELDLANQSTRNIELQLDIINTTSLAKSAGNEVLIGTSDAHVHFVNFRSGKTSRSIDFSSTKISRITDIVTSEGTMWIGSDGGLITKPLSGGRIKHFRQDNSKLSHEYVTKLFFEAGILLVGTYQGLDQVNPNSISTYNYRNSDIYNDVLAFTRNSIGELWVGTYNGIFSFDDSSGKHQPLSTSDGSKLPDGRIMALASVGSNILIGLQEDGLYQLDRDHNRLRPLANPKYSDLAVSNILTTTDRITWVASYNDGIFQYEDDELTRVDSGKERSFILLFEASNGTIFAGSERKLYKYDPHLEKFIDVEAGFPVGTQSPQLLSINEDLSGNLYLGTKNHGVFTWKNSSREKGLQNIQIFAKASLSNATIYGILFDEEGNMWCSTQSGIVVLDPKGDHKFRLTHQDGLQADDFNFGAYYLDSNQDMYFGGVNGYNKLSPRQVKFSSMQSPMVISHIEIGEEPQIPFHEITRLETLQLSESDRSFNIRINLLDFTDPTQNRYTHIMEGLDPDWIDDGTDNTITYTNLQPGEYVFRAKGANSAGIWNEEGVSLRILVLPPWWLTWWAYCLYVVAFLVVIWGAMRIYREHLLKEEAIKNSIEMQDAADRAQDDLQESHEQQDDLVRAVHQHNLATLDLIGKYLEPTGIAELTKPKIRGHLKAMELLEKCYYFQGGMLMADIHTYIDSLTSHLLQVARVDPAKITTINLTTSELLPASIASPAAVILYELLENALLHAFTEKQAAHFIEIRGEVDRSAKDRCFLLLSVSDDGVGFPRPESDRSQSKVGLEVVHSLAESLGGRVAISHDHGVQSRVSLPMPD